MKIGETIQGDFGQYTVVQTADGSCTLHSAFDDETCHSLDGAVGEALYNFVEGCRLREQIAAKGGVAILEIGFGCGVNFSETCRQLPEGSFEYVALERDQKLVDALRIDLSQCEILFGEATETVHQLIDSGKKFNAFFQDPFSPKKNPQLWTADWFSKLRRVAANGAILSTYSASRSVHKALTAAGWDVTSRKGFGRKRSATLAKVTR